MTEALLRTGLDDFLAWARGQNESLEPRATDTVLSLLSLRGARRRAGFPEPTADLLRPLMHEDLAEYCIPDHNEGLVDYLHVLTVLIARTRDAGLLNAKRQERMLREVQRLTPGLLVESSDRTMLSWPRSYGRLLLDDGVSLGDPDAVRAWLADFAEEAESDRLKRVLALYPGVPDESERERIEVVALATQSAGLQLSRLVLTAAVREARRALGGNDTDEPPLFTEPVGVEPDTISGTLSDDWVAAGLGAALRDTFAQLAPMPSADSTAPRAEPSNELSAEAPDDAPTEPSDEPPTGPNAGEDHG